MDMMNNPDFAAVANRLKNHFTPMGNRFRYDGFISSGFYGMTFRLVEKLSDRSSRRLAVKRAFDPDGERALRKEIAILRRVRGSEHVVKLIADRDDAKPASKPKQVRNIYEGLLGLTGPLAVLEFMENGTLSDIFIRIIDEKRTIPNRVLWFIFLCLLRACVGVEYPVGAPADRESVLEKPRAGVAPSKIQHGDLHMGNIMFGGIGGRFPEHELIPVLKFIDFGLSEEVAEPDNLYLVCKIMLELIAGKLISIPTAIQYNGFMTEAGEILPDPGNGANYPTMDRSLGSILARCLAEDTSIRYPLQQLLLVIDDCARYKTYPDKEDETDEAIRQFIQEFIFDAPTPK